MFVSAILAAGGRGARLGAAIPKQLLVLGDRTILQRSFETIEAHDRIDEIVVALPADLAAAPPAFLASRKKPVQIVDGGPRRQDSVANAFSKVSERAEIIVIHDAARPLASAALFSNVIEAADAAGSAIAAVPASDTVKEADEHDGMLHIVRTLPRERIYLAQTPQAFQRQILLDAIAAGRGAPPDKDATDEASLAEQAGHRVQLVDGERSNIKITTEQDLRVAELFAGRSERIPNPESRIPRIGIGYDLHRLEPGRPLVIGGVEIPHEMGLMGHSDADVLCHAITDAILGGSAQGDIGRHFPDSDPRWKGANSIDLLKRAVDIVRDAGFTVSNVDAVVIAEQPKLFPHIDKIRRTLAAAMGIDMSAISVKGKTNEKVGALGHNEAIAVHAVALLVHSR
jgi:2-C-methyl-D-erythritol 4-phosphate cytidylyltransferase / 2-C-methyl-D-erythritol 2,4-cyclodiphosphate synthase